MVLLSDSQPPVTVQTYHDTSQTGQTVILIADEQYKLMVDQQADIVTLLYWVVGLLAFIIGMLPMKVFLLGKGDK